MNPKTRMTWWRMPPLLDFLTRLSCLLIVALVALTLIFDHFGIDRWTMNCTRAGFVAAGAGADRDLDALQTAIERGDKAAALRRAAAPGLDVNAIDNDGHSPLTRAARAGMTDCCRLLLRRGANPCHVSDHGVTALLYTVCAGGPAAGEIVDLLVVHGADVDARMRGGLTPLMMAAHIGRPEVMPGLIAAGADLNATSADGYTALHWAAIANEPALATLLLNAGADPNVRDGAGDTPLAVARAQGSAAAAAAIGAFPPGAASSADERSRQVVPSAGTAPQHVLRALRWQKPLPLRGNLLAASRRPAPPVGGR